MAIAADFLKTPRFDKNSSFLAGKIASAEQASRTAGLSDTTELALGDAGRYSPDISSRLGAERGLGATRSQIQHALGRNDILELISRGAALSASKIPSNFKVDQQLIEQLQRGQVYDDKTLLEKYGRIYTPEQLAQMWDEVGQELGADHIAFYKWLSKINSTPTATFYKPQGGISGVVGTRGTGYAGLQEGFSTRLLALIRAAEKAGFGVSIGEGWRSYETQVRLKRQKPNLAATPGKSNHGWGLAADLRYSSAKARNWVHNNAARFGLRFPMSYEPWHIEPQTIRSVAMNGAAYESIPYDRYDAYRAGERLGVQPKRSTSRQVIR